MFGMQTAAQARQEIARTGAALRAAASEAQRAGMSAQRTAAEAREQLDTAVFILTVTCVSLMAVVTILILPRGDLRRILGG